MKKAGVKEWGEEGGTWVGWRGLSWKWSSSYLSTVKTSHMPTLDIAKWEWIDKIGSVKLGFLFCDWLHYYLNKNRVLRARKRRWNTWSKFKSMNSQWYQQTNSFGHHWSTLVKQLIVLKTCKLRERIMFFHWGKYFPSIDIFQLINEQEMIELGFHHLKHLPNYVSI